MVHHIAAGLLGLSILSPLTNGLPSSSVQQLGKRDGGGCASLNSPYDGYTLACNSDYSGPDIKAVDNVASFAGCAPLCDQTNGCLGFTFIGGSGTGSCYLKSQMLQASTSNYVDSGLKSASGACGALSSPYDSYNLACNTDYPGGDLVAKNAQSFQGCAPLCDQTQGCVGWAYVGGTGAGTCYLKQTLTNAVTNDHVDSGYNPSAVQSNSNANSNAGGSGGSGSNACTSLGSTLTQGSNTYTISCGTDYGGNDIMAASSSTFSGCFPICENTQNCVGFSYLPGTCYLKNKIGQSSSNSAVNSASKDSATSCKCG